MADIELFILKKLKDLELAIFNDKVDDLVARSSGLFIWCSTLFKYLARSRNPRRDMRGFLSGSTERNSLMQLYDLYDQILSSAVDMGHPEDKGILQTILGIIYVCSGNRPLSAEAIACFLRHDPRFNDEDQVSVSSLTRALHGVLYEDSNGYRALRVYHPSFLDYLKRKLTKNEGFIMNLSAVHELMATGCLVIMQEELKFNICCLEDSRRLNKDIPDLSKRIQEHISEVLQYSSLFWLDHVSRCGSKRVIRSVSAIIVSPSILHWLEVLSWLDALTEGVDILHRGSIFLKVCRSK